MTKSGKNTLAMEQTNMKKAFIQLHLSVLLSGFTGLFGKLITLNETTLTWYRIFFTAVILLVFTGLPKVGWKKVLQIAGCGTLLGFHWLLFYASIKASTMLLYEMVGGLVGVSVIIPVYLQIYPSNQPVAIIPDGSNLWWLLCLSLFCTVGLYLLQTLALKRLSAFTVNLAYNLEPCYTILIAFVAFGEARELNASFYVGISMVILSVLLQTLRTWRKKQQSSPVSPEPSSER